MAVCLAPLACNQEESLYSSCTPCGEGPWYVTTAFDFPTEVSTVIDGFNLDGHDSSTGDEAGCGYTDFTASDGTPGIDNQLGNIVGLVDVDVLGLIPQAFADGVSNQSLLWFFESDNGTPWSPDASHLIIRHLNVGAFTGPRDGIPGTAAVEQSSYVATLLRDPSSPEGYWRTDLIVIEFESDERKLRLPVHDFNVQLEAATDGSVSGVVGGYILESDIEPFLIDVAGPGVINVDALRAVLPLVLDMKSDPEGQCDAFSIGLNVAGTPVELD